jgi:hypothetical protein
MDELPVLRKKHGLTLLKGCRKTLERQILRACLGPSNEELHRMIERLKPQGKLNLVARNDELPDAAQQVLPPSSPTKETRND